MRRAALFVALFAAAAGASGPVAAATLRVSPVLIDLSEAQRAAVLTLANTEDRPLSVQVRVFRWTQTDGRDQLTPTRDVAVSPPATTLKAGAQHLVRVVRTAEAPPRGEESFRVLVDEIPDPAALRRGGVAFVLRQSLPVFFNSDRSARPELSWRLTRDGKALSLTAHNTGERRLRISEMVLTDARGAVVERKPGLLGYVLSGAEMRWPLQNAIAPNAALTLTAATDTGPLHVDLGPPPR